jgi:lipopolysaccharide transport system permease protein
MSTHRHCEAADRPKRGRDVPSSAALSPDSEGVVVIEAGLVERNYWADLWRFRELFAVLAWRDVAVRYKQTVIGIAWAILRPLVTIVIFTVVFGKLAKLPTEGNTPYSVLVFAGMLPWFLFSNILSEASNSLVGNANLISKVYFPRVIVPASSSVVALVDFGVNLVFISGVMAWYQIVPDWHIIFLPIFVVLAVLVSLGLAFFVTALNVKYRDFRYIVPFVMQFGLYVSPVGFSSSALPEHWRIWYSINPMVGVIDGFRWSLLGNESQFYVPGFLVSVVVAMLILWRGFCYFRRTERIFADWI